MTAIAPDDYSTVTETPGESITREAAAMLFSRYHFSRLCGGRRVLEVGCGSGQGLAYLARDASFSCGGDITQALLAHARSRPGGRIPLVRLDAHYLPFGPGSFDLVMLHEALYYLADPEGFLADVYRLLVPGGALVISAVNPEWPDFNPSPFATRYFSAGALREVLHGSFAEVRLFGGFPVSSNPRGTLVSAVKRVAVRLRLIPRTMRGKRWLKRVFLGPLVRVPTELTDGFAAYDEPRAIEVDGPVAHFKILYAVARRSPAGGAGPRLWTA